MNSRLFFQPDGSSYVLFVGKVLQKLYAHAQRRFWQTEAGGEIFTPDTGGPGIVITAATGPNPRDRRGRHSFIPDVATATADRLRQYEDGRHAVGIWHTHAEASPIPSKRDQITTEDYLKGFGTDRECYLLIIVGNAGNPPVVDVWAVEAGRSGVRWVEAPASSCI